jgi:hypothetical protein
METLFLGYEPVLPLGPNEKMPLLDVPELVKYGSILGVQLKHVIYLPEHVSVKAEQNLEKELKRTEVLRTPTEEILTFLSKTYPPMPGEGYGINGQTLLTLREASKKGYYAWFEQRALAYREERNPQQRILVHLIRGELSYLERIAAHAQREATKHQRIPDERILQNSFRSRW